MRPVFGASDAPSWNLVTKRTQSGVFSASASVGSGFGRQFLSSSHDLPRLLVLSDLLDFIDLLDLLSLGNPIPECKSGTSLGLLLRSESERYLAHHVY